jgi:hypothetical protein
MTHNYRSKLVWSVSGTVDNYEFFDDFLRKSMFCIKSYVLRANLKKCCCFSKNLNMMIINFYDPKACGLLFCSTCCNARIKLEHNTKEAQSRVCVNCFETLTKCKKIRSYFFPYDPFQFSSIFQVNNLKNAMNELGESNVPVSVLKKDGKSKMILF